MSLASSSRKGKEKAIEEEISSQESNSESSSDSESTSSSDTSESSDSESDHQEPISENGKAKEKQKGPDEEDGEDFIILKDQAFPPQLRLNPGKLPTPYLSFDSGSFSIRDPEVERLEKATAFLSGPAPPIPPPELTKSGKPFTKREKKELKHKTSGPDWFDMPAPSEADVPRLYREVEALRLRNQLDPKRFYRKDEGEGKGIKGLPKYFAIGTILQTDTPFGTTSSDNLTRANRKRTLVDELVDDAEGKRYAKKKFEELQKIRGAKGKNTLRAKARKPKW